jgi:hypothetical protein
MLLCDITSINNTKQFDATPNAACAWFSFAARLLVIIAAYICTVLYAPTLLLIWAPVAFVLFPLALFIRGLLAIDRLSRPRAPEPIVSTQARFT